MVSASDRPVGPAPILGAVGPGKALLLASAVQDRDREADESAGIIDGEVGGPLGPTTTTAVRARYIVRLAAAAALLQEIGNKAGRLRGSVGLEGREPAIRDALERLEAGSSFLDTSVYRRSRDLSAVVSSTIAQVTNRLEAGDSEGLRQLGRSLSQLGRSITVALERAANAAGEGRADRAGRAFGLVERRLANLERRV